MSQLIKNLIAVEEVIQRAQKILDEAKEEQAKIHFEMYKQEFNEMTPDKAALMESIRQNQEELAMITMEIDDHRRIKRYREQQDIDKVEKGVFNEDSIFDGWMSWIERTAKKDE